MFISYWNISIILSIYFVISRQTIENNRKAIYNDIYKHTHNIKCAYRNAHGKGDEGKEPIRILT